MRCPDRSADEAGRLRALAEYGIDETAGLPSLDPIVDMAAKLFDCPIAAVNMIGDDHVFLASSLGLKDPDLGRDVSFCAHAINQDEVMVVEDASLDPRFHDNPAVSAGAVHFYAGIALKAPSGHALGALCVIDNKPRTPFSAEDRARLKELAKLVSEKLELRRLEAVAAAQPSRFEASAVTSPNAVVCFDEHGTISTCNFAACAMFDREPEDMIGRSVDILIAESDRPLAHAGIARVRGGGAPLTDGTAMTGLRRSGATFPAELHWSGWLEGDRMHFGAIVQDTTEKRREHDTLYRLANYDALTDLPNRNLLQQRLEDSLAAEQAVAVVFSDLDGFDDINNTLGHAAGDRVLGLIGDRISDAMPGDAFVARIGNDEFAVVLHDRDPLAANELARMLITAIAEPIIVDGHEVRLAASCGLAFAPAHGSTAEELMGSAELALFQARSSGRGRTCLFTPNLRAEAVARRMHDAELHRAFEREQFVMFYQPQVTLEDGALTGAEALIRWKHPVRGLLSPAAFMPALEAGVLAEPVGHWVIDAACAQAARWRRAHPDFGISVNLSAAQFRSGELVRVVTEAIDVHRLPPEALTLEISENIILNQQARVLAQLDELRRFGVMLAFDDFGTGFASLNLLRTFPVTHIKIDKSFTQLMNISDKDRVIVTGLIQMAKQLGLKVVAEGIENEAAAEFLRRQACDKGQGFFYGKPVPPELFAEAFLAEGAGLKLA